MIKSMGMKKYYFVIILSFQGFFLSAQNFQNNYDRGKICANKKSELDSAVIFFTKAIEQDSNKSEVYLDRARLYDYKSEFSKAFDDYNKVIGMDSLCGRAYQGRANVYMKTNQRNKEIHDYRKAIELIPNDEKTYYCYLNLGIYIMESNGNIDTALYYINNAIDLTKKYKYITGSSCYYVRGKAFLKHEEYEKAIADFTTAIDLGFYSDCYLLRSNAYKKLGLNDKAEQDQKKYEKCKTK